MCVCKKVFLALQVYNDLYIFRRVNFMVCEFYLKKLIKLLQV